MMLLAIMFDVVPPRAEVVGVCSNFRLVDAFVTLFATLEVVVYRMNVVVLFFDVV